MALSNLTCVLHTSATEEKSMFPHMRILITAWSLQLLVRKKTVAYFKIAQGLKVQLPQLMYFGNELRALPKSLGLF